MARAGHRNGTPIKGAALSALALLAGAPFAATAGADPGQGAPIVFARRAAPAASAPMTVAAPATAAAPVRFQTTAAPRRAVSVPFDQPEALYGYGGPRTRRPAPPIDLRGALNAPATTASLADDAFETEQPPQTQPAPEAPAPALMAAAAAAPAQTRPDWLEQERTGAPYEAKGQWYVPTAEPSYSETGRASWYGGEFHGRRTASGEIFDSEALTAAHPTLPIPSLVQVTNLANGREVIVRVNDRGPFHGGRLIDVSRRAAEVLGFEREGQAQVHVRYLGPAPKRVNADGADVAPAPPLPAVAAAAPAPRAEAQAADGAFVVQVGAFSDPANAERARAALSGAGAVSVDLRPAAGATLHRVRVGAWSTRHEAEAARQTVASLGYPGAVVTAR